MWKKICAIEDLQKRQVSEFRVDGINVAVVYGDQTVAVIPPMCPHLEEPLRDGFCDGRVLTCHKHLWQWDLETGAPCGEARKPLKRYLSKVERGDVFAFIESEIFYDYE